MSPCNCGKVVRDRRGQDQRGRFPMPKATDPFPRGTRRVLNAKAIPTKTFLELYVRNPNPTVKDFGVCPQCGDPISKVYWGWAGQYYFLVCRKGHTWEFRYLQ